MDRAHAYMYMRLAGIERLSKEQWRERKQKKYLDSWVVPRVTGHACECARHWWLFHCCANRLNIFVHNDIQHHIGQRRERLWVNYLERAQYKCL